MEKDLNQFSSFLSEANNNMADILRAQIIQRARRVGGVSLKELASPLLNEANELSENIEMPDRLVA